MSEENQNKALAIIEKEEKEELKKWKKSNEAPLPLPVALKMYELYLNGYNVDEIWRVNGQRIPLGCIVDAKIRYEWDKRKEAQLAHLYSKVEDKVIRVKNEAISHLADLLSAAHKIWGDKVRMFLQEGDPTLLDGFDPSTLKNYKDLLAMLATLTTTKDSGSKEVKVDGTVKHVLTTDKKKMNSSTASELLRIIEENGEVIDG